MTDKDHQVQNEAHAEIMAQISGLRKDLEFHIAEVHGELMVRSDIEAGDRQIGKRVDELSVGQNEISRQLTEVADIVLGQPHVNYDGEVVRTKGLQDLIKDYNNGGIHTAPQRLHLSAGAWTAIVAGITILGSIAVALIEVAFGG